MSPASQNPAPQQVNNTNNGDDDNYLILRPLHTHKYLLCARTHCLTLINMKFRHEAGGVLCAKHAWELKASVRQMQGRWRRRRVWVGWSPGAEDEE